MAKPVFFYAHGTAYFVSANFDTTFTLLLGGQTEQKPGNSILVGGLNGLRKSWNLTVPRDPFPDLVNRDLWEVVRISYPAAQLAMGVSIGLGATTVINKIKDLPAGTPFALGGYSQGAAVMSTVLTELQTGSLTSRYSQLLGGVMYGNPRRMVNWRGPIGGTWSGAWDVPGSNTGGHGSFPTTGYWPRLTNPPDSWVEFTAPNDVFSSVGDSPNGLGWTAGNDVFLDLTQSNALTYLLSGMTAQTIVGSLAAFSLGGVVNNLIDVAGTLFQSPGNGHVVYPFLPPPNADGSYNTTTVTANGLTYLAPAAQTCYQQALAYLEGLANQWSVAPIVTPPKVEALPGWQTVLTPAGLPRLSAGWSTSI